MFCLTKILFHAHFLTEFRGLGVKFGSCMRTTIMEDSERYYGYGDEFIRFYGSMGNVETKSNGGKDREELVELDVTIRIL